MTIFATQGFEVFVQQSQYSLQFEPPDFGPFRPDSISDEELGSRLMLALEDRTLNFKNGRFQKSRNDFDVIRSVMVNYESISVSVEGISEIASLVVADVAEIIWASTGAD